MNNFKEIVKVSKNLSLLYVEDNEDVRKATLYFLEEFFDDIIIAKDGSEGFQAFYDSNISESIHKIDLIITDINMPIESGLSMAKRIRELDEHIPILILSAYSDTNYFLESISLGIDGYILKPIEMKQFVKVLNKVITKINTELTLQHNLHLLQQYQNLTDKSAIISKTDSHGIITYVNEEFCKTSKYSQEELIGHSHRIIRHPDNPTSLFTEMWDTIKNKKQMWKGVVRNLNKDKGSYYVNATITPILDTNNEVIEYIALRNDITEVMNPRRQLQDAIFNAEEPLVVMLKIENYDNIENFLGKDMIEEIDKRFSKLILDKVPTECNFDLVYSLDNGKYAITKDLKNCTKNIEEIIVSLKKFQQRINETKIDLGDIDYDISAILSISYTGNVYENVKLGIRELLQSKQKFIIADHLSENKYESARRNITTLTKVKKAIEDFRIISYFQPIVNNKTEEIEKYESLVRLVDENGDILPPFFFLDVAKEGQYYSDITAIVLRNSFNALKNTKMNISINLSALDIEKASTREELYKLLEEYKEDANRVVFELLEDENVHDMKTIKEFIQKVKSAGVKIAIDDFGAGYSNFERLLEYQPDILKIDGSLIKNIETSEYSLAVVKTIVTFAKSQNIQTIAEYAENKEIFEILKSLDVDFSQGYYFGKPLPL
ncbi:MAG: EAL domain-containing protein [Arcobacteraceae bacterium]|jgi:PAS domain S-box-containing protein|nr:EAL domain-containing protein [Arcobacteraceae bacterium]